MSGGFRVADRGRVDRSRRLRFSFDGRRYEGLAGDSLASALLANGVRLFGRSFKYHRPRGLLSAGSEEPSALVTVRRDEGRYTPNLPANAVELHDGLEAFSQNRWPSLAFDVGAINQLIAPFIPAGFYYKTFMWPRRAWAGLYEPAIRAAAGLGRAPRAADPDRYAGRFAHCDVLVIGGGPAGLSAAIAAAEAGARVILCEEGSELGGGLLGERRARVEGRSAESWLGRVVRLLAGLPNVQVLTRTTAFGYFPHNLVGLCERVSDHLADPAPELPRERLWQVRAREVILAAGAIERPLVFPDNDRPGVMLAGAARTFLNRFGVAPGRRAVVVTAHDDAYRTAIDLRSAGVEVPLVADVRSRAHGPWAERARAAGVEVRAGLTVTGVEGRGGVRRIALASVGCDLVWRRTEACDLVLVSGGFTPNISLFSQTRGQVAWSDALQSFVPLRSLERIRCVGACRGVLSLEAVIEESAAAGRAAAEGRPPSADALAPEQSGGFVGALSGADRRAGKAFVDWQNDVTVKDLQLAAREGFRSVEHAKRYTTVGMATDQGKTSNINALGVLSQALGKPPHEIGLTTFRMPYTPVSFGAFAGLARGDLLDPLRRTPIHAWAEARGAVFEDVGPWRRARYFPRAGETMSQAVARECRTVREAAGVFDASTLGKIEVVGPDAGEFMNRMYTNSWTKLGVGRCRYGVLLREDGYILDDGVMGRLAEDRFHVTTTTGGAPRVLAMMEDYLQTEWPDLQVWLTSTTEQWAVIAVQGPRARDMLSPLVEGVDLSAEAMPHMSLAEGAICGVPMRLFRVSFTGELGFEVNVPSGYGLAVWPALIEAGEAYGATPYGTETMHVLRREGLHHHRTGDGRHGQPRRRGAELGHRQGEAGLRRQALAHTAGDDRRGPQAAGRPFEPGCRAGV